MRKRVKLFILFVLSEPKKANANLVKSISLVKYSEDNDPNGDNNPTDKGDNAPGGTTPSGGNTPAGGNTGSGTDEGDYELK